MISHASNQNGRDLNAQSAKDLMAVTCVTDLLNQQKHLG